MFKTKAHEARSLKWWRDRQDKIDFDPSYQRHSGIWSKRDRAFLIDSILNQYDIPKIYLADFRQEDSTLNASNKMYAIIDGKQRLHAIFEFFNNNVVLAPDFVYAIDPKIRLAGLRYRDLAAHFPKVRQSFDDYEIQVTSVVTDEAGKIDEMFIRLNRALTRLTGAEFRNALPGIVPGLIKAIADDSFFQSKTGFEVLRYQDREVAAKLLYNEYRGQLSSTKRKDLDQFVVSALDGGERKYRQATTRVVGVLRRMDQVFSDHDALLRRQAVVPLYYWVVRGLDDGLLPKLRPFLSEFDAARRQNESREEAGSGELDPELLEFGVARRSPNDETSMARMYAILTTRFDRYLERSR